MTGSIKTSNLNQQLFWSFNGLKQAWERLTPFSNHHRNTSKYRLENTSEITFTVPDVFDDYAVEGEEPADLALMDLIPAELALLNLPPAAHSQSTTTQRSDTVVSWYREHTDLETDELASLIPRELSAFSLQSKQAA